MWPCLCRYPKIQIVCSSSSWRARSDRSFSAHAASREPSSPPGPPSLTSSSKSDVHTVDACWTPVSQWLSRAKLMFYMSWTQTKKKIMVCINCLNLNVNMSKDFFINIILFLIKASISNGFLASYHFAKADLASVSSRSASRLVRPSWQSHTSPNITSHSSHHSSFLPEWHFTALHSGPQLHTASSAICWPAQCLGWVTQSWSALSVFVSSCRSLLSTIHGPAVWLLDMLLCSVRLVLPEGLFEVTEGPNAVWDFSALPPYHGRCTVPVHWVSMTQPLSLSWQSSRACSTEMNPCVHPLAYLERLGE